MTFVALPAAPGPYVDTDVPVTRPVAAALRAAGKIGIFRYGPLPNNATTQDLSSGELADLCDEGLQVGLIQHVRGTPDAPLWVPSAHDPAIDAEEISQWAIYIGYPAEAHIFLDLEAIHDTRVATIAFCIGWQKAIRASGYSAGCYHGFSVPLSAEDLYELPGFNCYFSDSGNRPVAHRGNAILQGAEVSIGGTRFDLDAVSKDRLKGLPFLCSAVPVDGDAIELA